jgi:hypothetical protein
MLLRVFIISIIMNSIHTSGKSMTDTSLVALSQKLLYAVRTEDSSDVLVEQLSRADMHNIYKQLSNDANKKAFWLNIYNAFVQRILKANPGKYKNKHAFFTDKQIVIAGQYMSMDDIEHGILRRSKVKWGLGYLNKLFPSSNEKRSRVKKLDKRIHFALNCGAKSCPPVAFYASEKIDHQLELATKSYLKTEVEYDKSSGIVSVPAIMGWFRADFGGKKGIKKLLVEHGMIDAGAKVRLQFKKYDWTLFLNNYTAI